MILNLPDKINTSILDSFDLGASDAVKDGILWDCFCDIDPIKTFLEDKHSIIIGTKGAGKTAVFTLLKEKHIYFNKVDKDIIISIDDPIEYSTAAHIIESSLKSKVNDSILRYQFLWEVYILYKICLNLKDKPHFESIKERVDSLCNIFLSDKPKSSFFHFLTSSKKKIGFKLDMSNPAFPSPDFYISSEPSSTPLESDKHTINIDLESIKKEINKVLDINGHKIYLLVDNLDDFVAKDEYITQRHILHAIINCCRAYYRYSNIKLKLSIRSDLFHKLDFSQLGGYDKISPETIELKWNDSDIRHFIARRLAFNLITKLNLKGLKIEIDKESLYLPPPERKLHFIARFISKIKRHDESEARTVTTRDQIDREVITSIFPREVIHRDISGGQVRSEIFTYLSSHFDLGDNHPTPRIMLLFLKKLINISSAYYRDNIDQKTILKNEKGEYPLLKREHFMKAYATLQKDMYEIFKSCMTIKEWQQKTELFFSRKGKRTSFQYSFLNSLFNFKDEDDTKAYLAYLTHLGVLKCKDDSLPHSKRTYELPIILQVIYNGYE